MKCKNCRHEYVSHSHYTQPAKCFIGGCACNKFEPYSSDEYTEQLESRLAALQKVEQAAQLALSYFTMKNTPPIKQAAVITALDDALAAAKLEGQ